MRILTALNAFKGAPREQNVVAVNEALASSLRAQGHEVKSFPIADGGDGTIDAFSYHAENKGSVKQSLNVKGPLDREVQARWLHLPSDKTAIIEMAQASGLALLGVNERNPLKASSYGTGQLVRQAVQDGAKTILLTVGGSATVDGGMGMLRALGAKFTDASGKELTSGGEDLEKVVSVNLDPVKQLLGETRLVFLCDVITPFMEKVADGQNVLLYAPQKFPDPSKPPVEDMAALRRGVENFARVIDKLAGKPASCDDSTGAAGGITYVPKAQLAATSELGFDRLATMFDLETAVKNADVVITGEGKLDESTFQNKAPHQLIELARKHGKKVVFVCGGSDNRSKSGAPIDWKKRGIDLVIELLNPEQANNPATLAVSIQQTLQNIVKAVTSKIGDIEGLLGTK